MVDKETVERVAKAIARAQIDFDIAFNGREEYDRHIDSVWKGFKNEAKAAIAAVRPTSQSDSTLTDLDQATNASPVFSLAFVSRETNSSAEKVSDITPLEWAAKNEGLGHGRTYYGTGIFGHWYGVQRIKTGAWNCFHHVNGKVLYLPVAATLDEAKATAVTDYEERIRAALVSSPSTRARG
jgi:hypothetical protein